MTSRSFPLAAALTLSTGTVVGPGMGLPALAGHLLGRPCYLHELADEALCVHLRSLVLAQHPDLALHPWRRPESAAGSEETRRYGEAFLAEGVALFGPVLAFEAGASAEPTDPAATFSRAFPGKPLLVCHPREEK